MKFRHLPPYRYMHLLIAGAMGVGFPLWAVAQSEASAQAAKRLGGNTQQVARLDAAASESGMAGGYTMAFLQGMPQAADIKSLLAGNDVVPGTYRVDIYVNTTPAGRRDIAFSENSKTGAVEPCLTADMLTQLGIDVAKAEARETDRDVSACRRLPELIPQSIASYDATRLRLSLSVPQLYMSAARRGYIEPALWDEGVSAAFLDYSANTRRDWSGGDGADRTTSTNINMRMGANFGPWRLRNNSFVSSSSGRSAEFRSQNTYLQRGVNRIKSQLWMGETYTNSPLFDGVRFLGVQMASDEAMRPDSEQGYAPVIRGNADSIATVEVRQNGYLIYTTTVAPGPFEITDLAPSGSNGDLEITVIEADGSRRVQRQAFSSPPLMVREGRVSYDVAVGQFRQDYSGSERPIFGSASVLYGLTSNVTLAGGVRTSSGYQAYSVGVGVNTRFGAMSLDGAHSVSKVGGGSSVGDRLNLRYAKFLESTDTRVSVNVQRSLNDKYRSFSDHVYAKDAPQSMSLPGARYASSRSRVDVYLTQNVGRDSRYGNVYMSGSDEAYWDESRSRSLAVGYSNSLGMVAYSVGYTHARNISSPQNQSRYSDNTVSLTLSFPLGSGWRAPQAYSNVSRQGAGTSIQAGVTGQLPTVREIDYGVAAGRGADGRASGSASLGTTTSFAKLGAGYNYGNHRHSGTMSANGSVVLHGGGVNLGQSLGETFVLAKVTPPVAGVALSSYAGIETGRNGFAVVPAATPFRGNWVDLNTRDLSSDVEFDNATQQVIPTRGAIALATFKADTGRRVQFELFQPDGKPMHFGATVDDASGNRLGITDPRGRVLTMLAVEREQGVLNIRWDGKECLVEYTLPAKAAGENYQRVALTCTEANAIQRKTEPAGKLAASVTQANSL